MLKTILLGIVQGIAEFLPVSSSGHLVLFQKLMGMPETGLLMEILLHVGTLFAVLAAFRREITGMLRHPLTSRPVRLLFAATLPAVVAALLLGNALDAIFSGWFLGFSFLITSGLLFASEALARRSGADAAPRDIDAMTFPQALGMGLMQAAALVPGVSRSGATIVGGLACGVPQKTAAEFSFLMSAVATAGSLVYKLKDLAQAVTGGGAVFEGGMAALSAGMLAAAVSGYAAIRWLLRLLERASLRAFGYYTAVVGLLVLCDQLFVGRFFERILL